MDIWIFQPSFFSINFFKSRLFVKNQLIWQLPFDDSSTQRLFLPRCFFLFYKIVHMLVRFWYFSNFYVLFKFWFWLLEIAFLCNMRDFNFVSIKIQPLFTLSFWKTVEIFFINAVSEIWHFFAKFFNLLSVWFSLYFFVLFSRMDLCLGWLIVFSISRILNNEVCSFFLIF